MRLALAALLLALSPPALGQQRVYVDREATGANTGTSWANAFTDLQAALAFARGRAGAEEVWVAEGTYRPTAMAAREVSFKLFADVALYGGFAGTETSRDQRDWAARPTILSGDIGAPGVRTDNTIHVVLATGFEGAVTATTVLDGFTISGGYADGTGPAANAGEGAGLIVFGASPTLRHLLVTGNEATPSYGSGGGLYLGSATPGPLLEDVAFVGNAAGSRGGGLYAGFSSPRLVGCRFVSNRARLGGGAYLSEVRSATFRDLHFEANQATLTEGGGLYVEAGDVVVAGATFVRNRSALGGGGLYFTARGQHPFYLADASFHGNVAGAPGGGFAIDGPGATVANAAFVGNRAPQGGAVHAGRAAPLLVNIAASANAAAAGAGLFVSGGGRVANAVVWGNDGPEVEGYAGDPPTDVRHSIVEGGLPSGTAVLDADPLFTRAPSSGTDGVWGTADDDYGDLRLSSASPALDAGLASHLPPDTADLDGDGDRAEPLPLDLDGAPRVRGGALDLGPYEGAADTAEEPGPRRGPVELRLDGPNPFRGTVALTLHLSEAAAVEVAAYDALGRRVGLLFRGHLVAGAHRLTFDGRGLAPGVYVVRAEGGGASAVAALARTP